MAMLRPEALRNKRFDRLPEQLVAMVAEEFLGLRINQDDAPGVVHHNHRIRRGIQQATKKFFGALAIRNVTYHGADQQPVRTLHGTEADFDRELRTVLAQPEKFQSSAHGPQLRAAHEPCAVAAMFAPESFWYQRLDRLSD